MKGKYTKSKENIEHIYNIKTRVHVCVCMRAHAKNAVFNTIFKILKNNKKSIEKHLTGFF